jgi:hypothetical protein
MRIKKMLLVAAMVLSPLGFEAHGKEPVDGGKKSAKNGRKKTTSDSPKEPAGSGKIPQRHSCDTLTGIQELGNP